MSKKAASPLRPGETRILSLLLENQKKILEKQITADKRLEATRLKYKKSSAKLHKLEKVQSGHKELADKLEISQIDLGRKYNQLQKVEKELDEFQQKPEKLRQAAIDALLQDKEAEVSDASKKGDRLIKKYTSLRTKQMQLAAARHILTEKNIIKNETLIEASQGIIKTAEAAVTASEEQLTTLSTQQQEAHNTQIAIHIIQYCNPDILLIVEKRLNKEALSEQESIAIQSLFPEKSTPSTPRVEEESNLDSGLIDEALKKQLLEIIQKIKGKSEAERAEFLSDALVKAEKLENSAKVSEEAEFVKIQENHASIDSEKPKIAI